MHLQIRALRKSRKVTQIKLAELMSVDPKTIGNWERGETMMSAEQVWNCCVALDTDPNTLLGWNEEHSNVDPRVAELNRCWELCTKQRKDALLMTARDYAGASKDGAERDPAADEESA